MTPWDLVKRSEHSHQRALFAWANCAANFGFLVARDPRGYSLAEREQLRDQLAPMPGMRLMFAIHNQGHGDRIRGAQAKAEGVKAGVPDILLPVPSRQWAGLFIELKRPSQRGTAKGVLGENQIDWLRELTRLGYAVAVSYGWIEAANAVTNYLGYPETYRVEP